MYTKNLKMWYAKKYDPLQAGSIDGTDSVPHDHGIIRAQLSNYLPPRNNNDITNDPYKTLFVGRLNPITTEETLRHLFEKFGSIKKVKIVCNLVTGDPRGYAFIEFDHEKSCEDAYKNSYKLTIDDRMVLVDYERSRVMKGWIPRRLGGGFGGRKESGQLRFGAIDRPFKRPLHVVGNQNMPEILPDQKYEDCWRRQDRQRSKNDHYRSDRKKPDDRHSYSHDRNDGGDGNSNSRYSSSDSYSKSRKRPKNHHHHHYHHHHHHHHNHHNR